MAGVYAEERLGFDEEEKLKQFKKALEGENK